MAISRRVALAACAAALVVMGSAGAALSATRSDNDSNSDGRTYGTVPIRPGVTEGDLPDLVAVVGDHGVDGYVLSKELAADPNANPATPAEAIANQAKGKDRVLRVFTADGRTQVDTFTVWGPNHNAP